jgi:predicted membrane chloride channel (bestrophin family)
VFPTVVVRALFFACIGALAMYFYEVHEHLYVRWITPNTDMHTYMSMMVAMMIAFRTNNCYGRYDTGVSLTGGLKTHARIIVTQAAGYSHGTDQKTLDFVEEVRRLTMLFLLFFKRHMHEQVSFYQHSCGSCHTRLPADRSWSWRSATRRSSKCLGRERFPRCVASDR